MNHYIYIPGLGGQDTLDRQRRIIDRWPDGTRGALFVDARWHNKDEDFKAKFDRVCYEIKQYKSGKTGRFCVIGSSAGASMAVNVFDQLRLDGLVSIAGKMKHPEAIGTHYRRSSPHFYESVVKSHEIIRGLTAGQKARILTISPLFDEVVVRRDMTIDGVPDIRLWIPGHVLGIGYAIKYGRGAFLRWFEKLET